MTSKQVLDLIAVRVVGSREVLDVEWEGERLLIFCADGAVYRIEAECQGYVRPDEDEEDG